MNQFTNQKCSPNPAPSPVEIGVWQKPASSSPTQEMSFVEALRQIKRPLFLVNRNGTIAPELNGNGLIGDSLATKDTLPLLGYAPSCPPESLGNMGFCTDLGIRFSYLGGSMAKGISSIAMVQALGESGMLGFYGAAGLPLSEVESAVQTLTSGNIPFGCNLIHSPQDPDLEHALADLYIRKGVHLVEASAFLDLTLPLVRYRTHGIHRDRDGRIVTPNRIIAKVSREELASKFFAPPPLQFLKELVAKGEISAEQAELATHIPMAQDITAEADSGGHTDNRPALTLLPTIQALATRLSVSYNYDLTLRVGLAGGISTPAAAVAAFAMGADYIMTGSVNQACIESGTSEEVRTMLAETRQADVTMAPAADMFEMGVTVQVLKRGTMFPMRAAKLYELYRAYDCLEDIPASEREKLEKTFFRATLGDIWKATHSYFMLRDPREAKRGEQDPKHRMALTFRWYLGQAAHWAKDGESSRRIDYQIWCGPAMGAFNEWTAGSFMATPQNRKVATVALNIMFGAALLSRISFLRNQGLLLPAATLRSEPLEPELIKEYLR